MSSVLNLSLDDYAFFRSQAGKSFLSHIAMQKPREDSPALSLEENINKAISVIFFLREYRMEREAEKTSGILSVFGRLFSSVSSASERKFFDKFAQSTQNSRLSFEEKAGLIQDFIWLIAQAKADGRHEGEFFSALRSMLKFLPLSVAEHFQGLEGRPAPFLNDLKQVQAEFGVNPVSGGLKKSMRWGGESVDVGPGIELKEGVRPRSALVIGGGGGAGGAVLSVSAQEDAASDRVEGAGTPFSSESIPSPVSSPTAAARRAAAPDDFGPLSSHRKTSAPGAAVEMRALGKVSKDQKDSDHVL